MESNIDHLELNEHDSFAIYRLPFEKNTILIHQNGQAKVLVTDNHQEDGFIFHPFDNQKEKSYFIQSQKRIINSKWSFSIKGNDHCISTNKANYLAIINKTIEDINGELPKIVMSRIIKTDRSDKSIKVLFDEMCSKYLNAFCYVVHIPSIGCWMGATPEKLIIEHSKNIFTTMSLAGTHQVKSIPQKWTSKEIEEQLIVTKYLRSKLAELNLTYKEDKLTTLHNGPVEHLCTHFEFKANNIFDVVESFHPTPAVCGMPKEQSKQYIIKNEGYNRKYYTGYLGPTQHDGLTKIYVNLRCMQVFNTEAKIYVGGGITKSSNAEDEWEETKWKAKILLGLLK